MYQETNCFNTVFTVKEMGNPNLLPNAAAAYVLDLSGILLFQYKRHRMNYTGNCYPVTNNIIEICVQSVPISPKETCKSTSMSWQDNTINIVDWCMYAEQQALPWPFYELQTAVSVSFLHLTLYRDTTVW